MREPSWEAQQQTLERMHACRAVYIQTIPVREQAQGRVIWEGDVHVFTVLGHPSAAGAYTWAHPVFGDDPLKRRIVVVLHQEPVVSAASAVRAMILKELRHREEAEQESLRAAPATLSRAS